MTTDRPARELNVSLADLDRVIRSVARHQADSCIRGDLDAAKRDGDRIDAYLDQRLRVMRAQGDAGRALVADLLIGSAVAVGALAIGWWVSTLPHPAQVAAISVGVVLMIAALFVAVVSLAPTRDDEPAWSDERPETAGPFPQCTTPGCPRPAARNGHCLRHLPQPVFDQEKAS